MPKTTIKSAVKAHNKKGKTSIPVDELLADHLKQAEAHLIAACKLFSGPQKPNRVPTYWQRLHRAQEAVTWLYREELVRIRGPLPKKGR